MSESIDNEALKFRVSSGLKNIIGKDLISDKFIAVFELVKNSYDAGATKVTIKFDKDTTGNLVLSIADDGCGMTREDIQNKWLFVAYSEKKKENRSADTYVNKIKRVSAGAKGVGRFSCDRLGKTLTLYTKSKSDDFAHVVNVDWHDFEISDSREFETINVQYSDTEKLPHNVASGTYLCISDLREEWDRKALLSLKQSLMKLINPDNNSGDLPFEIYLDVPSECDTDQRERDKLQSDQEILALERKVVNGRIRNDIFEKLNLKTVKIDVNISEDGKTISTQLTDRGEEVFNIVESNRKYTLLNNINFTLFFLNKVAKDSFKKQMGIIPKDYGSVFIYKNGFRINPFGNPGEDFFGIDARKAQGYKRYLGTREVIGRISITGDNPEFIETSSRDNGFIQTESVLSLSSFFVDKVLKVLEKYVVSIIFWAEPRKDSSDNQIVTPAEALETALLKFLTYDKTNDIISVSVNEQLLSEKEKTSGISQSLKKLLYEIDELNNKNLQDLSKDIDKKTQILIKQNISLEKENERKTKELSSALVERDSRIAQVHQLENARKQSVENLLDGMHSIFTQTETIRGNIQQLNDIISKLDFPEQPNVLKILTSIAHSNRKSNKIAEMAIKGNQTLSLSVSDDIREYIVQYIRDGLLVTNGLKCIVEDTTVPCICKYNPSGFGIVLDNIVSNSIKAGSDELVISFSDGDGYVFISFTDNGRGLESNIDTKTLFEYGFSTKVKHVGFGLGLPQIKKLIEKEMKGKVFIDLDYNNGFRLVVGLKI